MEKKINVLIIDDSAVVRKTLTEILSSSPEINVIGTANDPFIATTKMTKQMPDVITLDIEMPKMDGITFLRKVMVKYPVPVVVISALTDKGSLLALEALRFGAAEIITKPKLDSEIAFSEYSIRIIDAVKAAAAVKPKRTSTIESSLRDSASFTTAKLTADVIIAASNSPKNISGIQKIIAIGASTGGTEAISFLLKKMKKDVSGIVIVQHMPEIFTRSFADRLNKESEIWVKEAENNDKIEVGKAIIAPGNKHIMIRQAGNDYYIQVMDGPLVNRHRPSVDVLFRSVANEAGKNALGILLTGMGTDGAQGLLEMKNAEANTIAQNEESSVVFGMPKEAIKIGAASQVLSLNDMPEVMTRFK